jgi:hypothetical protein
MLQDSGDLTVSEKLSKLKLVCGSDGVHLKTEGTRNVAKNVKLCKKSAAVPISGDAIRHFWRGYAWILEHFMIWHLKPILSLFFGLNVKGIFCG